VGADRRTRAAREPERRRLRRLNSSFVVFTHFEGISLALTPDICRTRRWFRLIKE
jgi:hypothetical protein